MARRRKTADALTCEGPTLTRLRIEREHIASEVGYPFSLPIVASFHEIAIRQRVLFFVGENGSGKSTLLEAIAYACGFAIEGGTRNFNAPARVAADTTVADAEAPIRRFADALRPSFWPRRQPDGFFLRAETFYDFAKHLDGSQREASASSYGVPVDFLTAYGGASLHDRSHGESFFRLFLTRIGGGGLYIFDEPEAALSAARQFAMLVRMRELLAASPRTQFIIATHSPILLAYPDAQIVSCDGDALRAIDYRRTDAFVLTRRFLNDHEAMLRRLFAPPDAASTE